MTLHGDVARRLAFRALGGLRGGELVLRYPGDGHGRRFGDGRGPRIVVDVRRPDLLWSKLARRTRVGVGASYVDGDWDCDDLVGLFSLLGRAIHSAGGHAAVRAVYALQRVRPHRTPRQTQAAARDNIRAHYDLGNDLFALMLDPTMTYSCAYWERPGMSLEDAQRAKLRLVCEKLRLGPEDHVLEIGCGWGSFALLAASEYGSRVTGLTLSPSQAAFARERVAAAGLERRVEIREQDYRAVQERYSCVASIEMLEAIGLAQYGAYFRTIDRVLAPDGAAVIQTIAVPDDRFERYRRTPDWIQQEVFPGSLLPSLEAIARAVARTRLLITGVEEIGIGYARTLSEWRANVRRQAGRLRELGYDERFQRRWTFYLAYCEAAFAIRALRDVQLVVTRSFDDTQPTYPTPRLTY